MDFGAVILGLLVAIVFKLTITLWAIRLLYKFHGPLYSKAPRRLWLLIPEDDRPEVKVLYWSLFAFFMSEFFCGIETYIIMQSSSTFRYLHALSSGLGMGLFASGLYLYFNKKILRFTQSNCFMNKVCKGCPRIQGGDCKFSMSIFLIMCFILVATFPPLFASTAHMNAEPQKFILPFPAINNWYEQTLLPFIKATHPKYKPVGVAFFLESSPQVFYFKVLPVISFIIGLFGAIQFKRKKEHQGLVIFLFAAGILSYSYYELITNRVTNDLFIGAIMHEIGELMFLAFLAEFLRTNFSTSPKIQESKSPNKS